MSADSTPDAYGPVTSGRLKRIAQRRRLRLQSGFINAVHGRVGIMVDQVHPDFKRRLLRAQDTIIMEVILFHPPAAPNTPVANLQMTKGIG